MMKRQNIKVVGYITCALCMTIMVGLLTIGVQADDKKIEFVKGVTYTADNTIPTAPTGYSQENGYLFAGWYVADANDNVDGYSPVREPVTGKEYYAKYVPSEVLGLKAQISAQIKNNDTDKIQNSSVDNAIRFVTSLDSTEYNHIGFNIKIAGTSYDQDAAVSKDVYTQIYGIGADKDQVITYVPKDEFHSVSKYVKTYTFTTIPEAAFDSDIKVTPYWITLDGTRVDGPETVVRTVNYCRAWVYVDDSENAVTNEAAPVGTSSNPYGDLQTALDVDGQTLVPKVILKSDYELSTTVTASQSLTLASVEEKDGSVKSIQRAAGFMSGRMLTVSPSDTTAVVTMEDIILDGKELGACVNIKAGTLHMQAGSTITNGKLTGSGKTDTQRGANVIVQPGCTLTMEDESLISNGSTNSYGGNVLVNNGSLTMNGGTITGGKAITTEDNTTDQMGCGGNIHAFASSVITLNEGAVISDGVATSLTDVAKTGRGGNISSTGTVTVNGGTISGGTASSTTENMDTGCGGNLFLSTTKFTLTDGQISGGTAVYGGNICTDKALTLSGGTISGGAATYGGNVYLYAAQTDATTGVAGSLKMSGGTISGGTAEKGGNIYVARGIFTAEDNTVYHKLATLTVSGGTIDGGTATVSGGNIYTIGTMTMTGGTISEGEAMSDDPQYYKGIGGNICVEGVDEEHYATLKITGGVVTGGQVNGRGGNIDAHQYAELVLGTKSAETNDLAIVEDGTVSNTVGNANGGNIFARGYSKVTIYNGITIRGGSAGAYGGNVMFDSPEAFVINGGSIEDGTAGYGGNLYFSEKCSQVTMNDGTFSGGKANKGGSIYIARKNTKSDSVETTTYAVITMNGGTIEGGWATDDGGNIYCYGELIMNAGTIREGLAGSAKVDGYRGGNIYVHGDSKDAQYVGEVTVNAGSITGGMAGGRGGNIHLSHATLTLGSGIINITDGQIVNITISDENEPVVTSTSTTAHRNVSMYGDTTPRQIIVEGTMNLASKIGISVSSSNNKGLFATGATEYFNKYQRIFISDVSNKGVSLSDKKLSIVDSGDIVDYYTAANYLADESLFVPSWKGVWTPPAELLDFEKKWEAFFTPNGRLMCMAHRGDNDICYPENSIEGIMSCIQAGVDFLELDVRTTKDGVRVLMHDETITRTTNVNELRAAGVTGLPESDYLCDWTLAELRELRLVYEGSSGNVVTDYVIPTLEDAIEVCKDKIFVFLDNKAGWKSWINEIYPIIQEYGAYRSVWLPPGTGLDKVSGILTTVANHSGYKAAFQAEITPDNVATVVATIEENGWPKALRAKDYNPTFDTAYASYFGKYRISTNALYGDYKNNLEAWKELYKKGYNTLHVDDYMTLVQYIAEQM